MIEGCLGPSAGDGGENAQRATPVLEQELLDAGGGGKRGLDHRPRLRIERVRLHVARGVEILVQAGERRVPVAEPCVHRGAARERVAAKQRHVPLPGPERLLDECSVLRLVRCDQRERIDRQQVRIVAMRFLPRPIASDHKPRGIARERREVRAHVAPARQQRVVDAQAVGARDQRLETPAQQRQVVVRVGHRRQLRRVRGREMKAPVLSALDIRQVVPHCAPQQRIDPLAQDAVVHLVAVMEPVVVERPRQVAHLVRGVTLRGPKVDGAHEVGAGAAPDRRRVRAQPLGDVIDQRLPVAVEIPEQRFRQVEPIRPEQRRVGELDVQVPPDRRPGRGVEPGAVQIQNGPVGAHRGTELVDLNPVVRFETRVREREETRGIVAVPPRPMRRDQFRQTEPRCLCRGTLRVALRFLARVPVPDADVESVPLPPPDRLRVRTAADERLHARHLSTRACDGRRRMQILGRERLLAGDFAGRPRLGGYPVERYSSLPSPSLEHDHDH